MKQPKWILNVLLLTGTAICLLQVWLPAHYLTCDGPCHLYNAQIVHDLWNYSKYTALYRHFYDLVYTPDPNSMTTFVLASLLFFVKGATAEKLFLSAYVLVFVTGYCVLLRKISNRHTYWQLSVFVLVFTYALAKGFYNFSFGIAFYFWMVWSWLRLLDKRTVASSLLFFVLTGLTFFTHLLPFVFGGITCGALLISHGFAGRQTEGADSALAYILKRGATLLLLTLPYLILTFVFTGKEGGLQLQLGAHPYRLLEALEFKYIINVVDTEHPWAAIAGITLSLFLIYVVVTGMRKITINKYDGLLLALIPIAFVYTFFPEDFMGRAIIISIRTQMFLFILIGGVVAYRLNNERAKTAGALLLFVCFVALSYHRIECRQDTEEALSDYLSADSHIRAGSVVLPFDFSPNGKRKDHTLIADRNAVFHHASQYLGVSKPLIILDNYEANMGYFPIRWKDATNPYNHLSKEEGIEGLPPFAKIAAYKRATNTDVDYILFWCYDPAYISDPHFAELYREINSMYTKVYETPGGRTMLYAKNTAAAANDLVPPVADH
jgi:hypothetical protein